MSFFSMIFKAGAGLAKAAKPAAGAEETLAKATTVKSNLQSAELLAKDPPPVFKAVEKNAQYDKNLASFEALQSKSHEVPVRSAGDVAGAAGELGSKVAPEEAAVKAEVAQLENKSGELAGSEKWWKNPKLWDTMNKIGIVGGVGGAGVTVYQLATMGKGASAAAGAGETAEAGSTAGQAMQLPANLSAYGSTVPAPQMPGVTSGGLPAGMAQQLGAEGFSTPEIQAISQVGAPTSMPTVMERPMSYGPLIPPAA